MSEQAGTGVEGVLGTDTQRVSDEDAQSYNISTGRALADVVRSTLGPNGMDKMLVSDKGRVTVSNDGVTILREMDIDNATAEMLVEVAQTQEQEVGDGTTTAVTVAGELLAEAEDLIERGVHPSTVMEGFRLAGEHAVGEVSSLAHPVEDETLRRVAETSLTGTRTASDREEVAALVVDAVSRVAEQGTPTRDDVVIEAWQAIGESRVVDGFAVRQEPLVDSMPETVEDAKILLLTSPLEMRFAEHDELEESVTAAVSDAEDIQRLEEKEDERLAEWVERIVGLGADAVFCTEGVDQRVAYALAREGVYALSHVTDEDLESLPGVTGAHATDLENADPADLGRGSISHEDAFGATLVEAAGADTVTILCHDPDIAHRGEFERTVEDAVAVVVSALVDGRVVAGGGATEVALSRSVRAHADSVAGREQLAVEAFADALEVVPVTLARNAGLDPVDALVDLRTAHDRGETATGVGVDGDLEDMRERGVLDPAGAKEQAVWSAVEAANRVLKIDDIIAASGLTTEAEDDEGPPDPTPL